MVPSRFLRHGCLCCREDWCHYRIALGIGEAVTTVSAEKVSDFYCDEALSGNTPVKVVEETDTVLAFEHTRPSYPVHIVVVPKKHTPSLVNLGEGGEELLMDALRVSARWRRRCVRSTGRPAW